MTIHDKRRENRERRHLQIIYIGFSLYCPPCTFALSPHTLKSHPSTSRRAHIQTHSRARPNTSTRGRFSFFLFSGFGISQSTGMCLSVRPLLKEILNEVFDKFRQSLHTHHTRSMTIKVYINVDYTGQLGVLTMFKRHPYRILVELTSVLTEDFLIFLGLCMFPG
jgi:hypothetical protein